jgi:hypothetical protein
MYLENSAAFGLWIENNKSTMNFKSVYQYYHEWSFARFNPLGLYITRKRVGDFKKEFLMLDTSKQPESQAIELQGIIYKESPAPAAETVQTAETPNSSPLNADSKLTIATEGEGDGKELTHERCSTIQLEEEKVVDTSLEKEVTVRSPDINFDAAKAISQVNTSSGMAAFVAGFCSYEVGKFNSNGYPFTNADNYVNSLVAAFVFAILSVSISSMITRYGTALKIAQAQAAFAVASNDWVRRVHRSYLLCYLCIGIALLFVGEVYYPTNCGTMRQSCDLAYTAAGLTEGLSNCTPHELEAAGCFRTTTRFVPIIAGALTILAVILGSIKVVAVFLDAGGIELADDTSKITREQAMLLTQGVGGNDTKEQGKEVDNYVKITNTLKGQVYYFCCDEDILFLCLLFVHIFVCL